MWYTLALSALLAPTLVWAAASPGSAPALSDNPLATPRDRAVDRAARGYLSDQCRGGLSIAIMAQGHAYFYDYGTADRDRARLPRPDSVYELASVTKTFTGALAARALVDGKMSLDGDFRQNLPGDYPNLTMAGQPITLRSLATHTSGMQRDLPDSDALMRAPDYDHMAEQLAALNKGFTRSRSLAGLHQVVLRSVPNARFVYSNLGIRAIGYGLEQAYHLPFDRLLTRNILAPLRMADTTFAPGLSMRKRLVKPYNRYGHLQPYHDPSAGAAYGLYSTPHDMARYIAWQLDERNPVVARAHLPIRGTADDGEGLIWNIGRDTGEEILWHGGGSFGETSQMVLYSHSREGFVLLANDACPGSESALKDIALAVHRAPS